MSERFAFGDNWRRYVELVDETRIDDAERSLRTALGRDDLTGVRFLDIGCGSGLFSLAAIRLGAREVVSFDLDPDSVEASRTLRARFTADDARWRIEQGSALDASYVHSLGLFDVVYSWGVLHHTGAMWDALSLAMDAVAPDGSLYIAIYNDQGGWSRRWRTIKRAYNRAPRPARRAMVVGIGSVLEARGMAIRLARRQNPFAELPWFAKDRRRGMDAFRDLEDWVGGYPFEVAMPEQVFEAGRRRGFELRHLRTMRAGPGCNEYVFVRTDAPSA